MGKEGGKNHKQYAFRQKRQFCAGESLLYTGFQVLPEEEVTLHQALVLAHLL